MHLAYPASLQVLHSNTWKQIIQIQHNRTEKPHLAEGRQLAIYKRGRGFELGTTENKCIKWPGRDSNPGPPDCKSDALSTRPRCLHATFVRLRVPFTRNHLNRAKIRMPCLSMFRVNRANRYIPRLSLQTGTAIGWFLVTWPWLKSNVSWSWYIKQCAPLKPRSGYITARDQSMVKSGVTEGGKNTASSSFPWMNITWDQA